MTISLPSWDDHYPDSERLRAEVRAGGDTFIQALGEIVPPADLAGIYVKGSSLKHWDSPLDYVPALSDVDVHVLFSDEEALAHFETLGVALELSRTAERRYMDEVPHPLHVPRIQLTIANELFNDPEYIPSPQETVETRAGNPYPRREPSSGVARDIAIKRTLEHQPYLATLPQTVADLTGPHLRRVLRDICWRVSPTGPRILELLGVDFRTCWSSNRTSVIGLLAEAGEVDMACRYREFYVGAWEYFLSGDRKGEPARQAIQAAVDVLERGVQIAARERAVL